MDRLTRNGQWARIWTVISKFRRDRRGNVAVITALSMLPLITAVGCVIDYSNASMIRTELQADADAASLATVSINSPVVNTAQAMTKNGTVSGGSAFAANFFSANLPSAYSTVTPTATVTKSGQTMTATVAFSTSVPTYFMGLIGYKNITVAGTSTSSYTMPTYINFYLMLDVSGSMSFPSTAAEQARLMAVNPDNLQGTLGYPGGCQFACHFTAQGACGQTSSSNPYQGPIPAVGKSTNPSPGGYCQGFIISRLGTTPVSFTAGTTNATNGNSVNWSNTPVTTCSSPGTTSCIQLRADAVGYAVNALLSTAAASEQAAGISNQFKVGLYPFIQNLYTYFALTSSITGSSTSSGTINYAAAQLANLLDTGQNASLGSGGTHFENALSSMNSLITSVGTGGSVQRAALCVSDHRRLPGLPDPIRRQLGIAKLDVEHDRAQSEFGDDHAAEQRKHHRLLPDYEKRGSLSPSSISPISRFRIQIPALPAMRTATPTAISRIFRRRCRPALRPTFSTLRTRPRTLPAR